MTDTTNPQADLAADALVAEARGAVHESLGFLAAPEADRVRALIADLETAVEGRTAIRFTAAATVPASAPTDRAAKAESLLLHFAAEAHRRKWAYDRGLHDNGVPVKSEAFDALHQLGDEMRTALDKLRLLADVVPVSGPGGAADETQQPVPADRPAIRAAAFDEAAAKLAGLDPVKAALAGQHAWNVAAGIVRHMAVQERRMADGEQQPETQADDGPRCTCADAGPAFAPAGHYADCPQAEQPAVEHCIHDRTVHRTHHKQAPVTGCPWCTAATSTED